MTYKIGNVRQSTLIFNFITLYLLISSLYIIITDDFPKVSFYVKLLCNNDIPSLLFATEKCYFNSFLILHYLRLSYIYCLKYKFLSDQLWVSFSH